MTTPESKTYDIPQDQEIKSFDELSDKEKEDYRIAMQDLIMTWEQADNDFKDSEIKPLDWELNKKRGGLLKTFGVCPTEGNEIVFLNQNQINEVEKLRELHWSVTIGQVMKVIDPSNP